MKNQITTGFSQLLAHRRLLWLLIATVVVALAAIIYIAVTIEASTLRIITHYTAYGITHFYRDQWTYLLAFIAFIVIVVVFAVAVAVKLLRQEREALALLYAWCSLALIGVTVVTYTHLVEFI